jgi:hypothetical protein
MKKFNIEDFFAGMRMKGWTVDPKYDRNGNAVRYRIGETPKGSDRVVMYGASELGHGRRLMASKLYDTWQQLHPEVRQETEPLISNPPAFKTKEQLEKEELERMYRVLKPLKEKNQRESAERKTAEHAARLQSDKHIQTKGIEERRSSIFSGLRTLKNSINTPFRTGFYLRDIEDVLPAAIAAKAIEDGKQQEDWCSTYGLERAAKSLVDMVEMSTEQATMMMEGLMTAIADMVLPPVSQSAGGGPDNNDLPKKKDDDWQWWKNNGFTNKQRRAIQR